MACSSGTSHIIQSGDTLFDLARQFLGDGNRWHEIKGPNGNTFTDAEARNLQVGQEVCLPFRQVKQDAHAGPSVGGMAHEILDAHNRYRSAVGLPPLIWSDALATHAQQWANHLAQNRLFEHAHAAGEGENLWMGTSGRFSFTQMVDSWGNEKQHFVHGNFPNVSTTGNWADVGHYTQIVWRNTTYVGGAGASGADGNYRLVCRYSPPGNFIGQKPF